MTKPKEVRDTMLQKLGVAVAEIHEQGSHGHAQFSNVIVTPKSEIALVSLHRSVVFTHHSSEKKMNCRKYDIMKIVQSLSTTDTRWIDNPNYQTFIEAYLLRLRETHSPTALGKMFHPVANALRRIFDNKSAHDIAKSIHNFYVYRYSKP